MCGFNLGPKNFEMHVFQNSRIFPGIFLEFAQILSGFYNVAGRLFHNMYTVFPMWMLKLLINGPHLIASKLSDSSLFNWKRL